MSISIILWIICFFSTLWLTYEAIKVHKTTKSRPPLGLALLSGIAFICAGYTLVFVFIFYDESFMSQPVVHFVFNWFWLAPATIWIYFAKKAARAPDRGIWE